MSLLHLNRLINLCGNRHFQMHFRRPRIHQSGNEFYYLLQSWCLSISVTLILKQSLVVDVDNGKHGIREGEINVL